MTVYKNPNCGCCTLWSKAMENAGFKVERVDTEDLPAVKKRFGVPAAVEGCHTAIVGSYFLDGHVPLEVVTKLLYERPDLAGLAVPGMPEVRSAWGAIRTPATMSTPSPRAPSRRHQFITRSDPRTKHRRR